MARKKLQKLFALLLTFSMTMSLLGVTAFAEDEDDVYLLEVGQTTTISNYTGVSQQDREKYTNHLWESNNLEVATVECNEDGVVTVTGVDEGTVTITHRYDVLVAPSPDPPVNEEEQQPSDTTPGDTTPGDTTPGDTTPGDTTPGDTTPGDTTPGDTTPGDTTPGDTTPGDTTPGDTTSGDTTSGDTTTQTTEAALVFNDPLDPSTVPAYSETWTFEVTAPEQETPEIPEETCDVEYKQMSDGVTFTTEKDGSVIKLNLVIGEEASGDLVLDLSKVIDEASGFTYLPGVKQKFEVTIQNNSGHTFGYKDNSFVLSTADSSEFGSLGNGLLPVLGYDGQYIFIYNTGSMIPEYFYRDLFKVESSGNVTFEMMCQIYEYLERAGYTGEDAMSRYVLRQMDPTGQYSSLREMYEADPVTIAKKMFAEGTTNNGIYTMSEEYLLEMIGKYPWIDPFLYVEQSGSDLRVQIKWPESQLASLSYDYFYECIFYFAYGDDAIDQLDMSDRVGENLFNDTHALANYRDEATYQEANAFMAAALPEGGLKNGESVSFNMAFGLNGPNMTNPYQNYSFSFYNVIELEQMDTSYTVRHEYYTNGKLTGSTESDPVSGLLVGDTVSVADIEKMLSYQGGDYEYTSTTPNETLTLTSNAADNVIVLRYDRTVEVEEPTFEWDISKSKTATPLDEDLKSQVTLSLPSAEEALESDIVFVVDKSTSSRDESTVGGLAMLEALNSSLESTKAVINVGIVVFDGTYHVMRELSPYDAADVAEKMSAEIPLEEDTSGTNIEAGLLAAQAMLEEHTSVANNRKYVILVSDGLTRLFTGPDGKTVQIIFNQLEADGTRYFGEYTTWCLSNGLGDGEYKVPGGVDWLTYYTTVIKPQVEADGDAYVMDFTGASTMTGTVPEKYIPLDEVQDHAQAIDRAFYDAYQAYLDLSTTYHCYAIYTGSSELGSSFMSTLSNGETLDFGDIQNDILYAVDKGSDVVDYIGYVAGSYDFDFVNDVSAMSLKVGETTYPAEKLADNRYGFKPVGDGTYAFTLEYERGNGLNEEHFTWTIGEAVSNFAPVQLTYTVKLVTPPTEPGDYKLDTNQIATLHPVNSDGTPGDPEDFEKPTVDYTVGGGTGPEGPGTDPTPPGGTDPTPPGGDGGTDIPDGNTPTTDLPDQETPTTELPEEETPTTELPEEETPLAEVPETGDMSALWLAMTALSGTGLAGVTFLGRKKRDEE